MYMWWNILKEDKQPLGPITEYHGTLDLKNVLKEGIRGNSPKKRSNRHIPKELKDVDLIVYTAEDKDEVIEYIKQRAKDLQIDEKEIGVVGVRGETLSKPIIHEDSIMNTTVFVREGNIPAQYLTTVNIS
jgi:hypothetical protein